MLFDSVDEFLFLDIKDKYWGDLVNILRLRTFLKQKGISKVVFNTFAGKALKLFLLINRSIEVFGVVHSISKLKKRYLVGALGRQIKGYFLLNDYLLPHCPVGIENVETFYPIFFPKYEIDAPEKADGELWVCIPGALEYKRRDYLRLIDLIDDGLDKRVRFVLLGNGFHKHGDGPDFQARVCGNERFILFDHYVDDELFHSYLSCSDLIMPLNGTREQYQDDSISGAINLAFSYQIPMVVEEIFREVDDFKVSSFFYDKNLVELLNYLCEQRDEVLQKSEDISAFFKFDLRYQAEKYTNFIR